MKKIIIGIFVALLLVGCSSESVASETNNGTINEKERFTEIYSQDGANSIKYRIIKDNKTNNEYLIVSEYKSGIGMIPLDDTTSQTENK